MALTPDPKWRFPAGTWDDLVDRYVRFRRVKAWRGQTHTTDGVLNPNRLAAVEGARVHRLLSVRIRQLLEGHVLPGRPDQWGQESVDLLVSRFARHRSFGRSPEWMQHLWRAMVLNRDCYTCRYCRRTAWDVHRELGATLRFEMDHKRPRSRLAKPTDFDLQNVATACRSCNVVKGQMPASRFLKELKSLGRATVRLPQGGPSTSNTG